MSPRLPNTPLLVGGTKRSAAGTLKKGAALVAASEREREREREKSGSGEATGGAENEPDALRKALSSDEFLRRMQVGAGAVAGPSSSSSIATSSAAPGATDGKRRQVVAPARSRATSPSATAAKGGVLHPRVPRSQTCGAGGSVPSSTGSAGETSASRSKSRSARNSPRSHAAAGGSPRLGPPPPHLQPQSQAYLLPAPPQALSLPPSPALSGSTTSTTSTCSFAAPSPTSASAPSSSACPSAGACPAPRGSTITSPLRPDEPAVTGVAVLASGELLAFDVAAAEWTLPTPVGSPPRLAGAGGTGRRCVSASPPTVAPLVVASSSHAAAAGKGRAHPRLPRGRESAPSSTALAAAFSARSSSSAATATATGAGAAAAAGRVRGSSNTSLASAAASTQPHPHHHRRRRTRGGSSSLSSSVAQTPLSSSPAERPPLQTYTSFEEQFGLCAPPSPPPSPGPPVKDEGAQGRWWQLSG
ncbi:hypothetical protein JCM6882_009381 [Rhodosporidiobolus microsporus]